MSNSFQRVFTNYTVFWLLHTHGFNYFVANCVILKIDIKNFCNAYLLVLKRNICTKATDIHPNNIRIQ